MGLLTQSRFKMDIWKLLTEQSHANRSLEKVDFTAHDGLLLACIVELSQNLPQHYDFIVGCLGSW
jgi:hypothetical protein